MKGATGPSLADTARAAGILLAQGAKLGMDVLGTIPLPTRRTTCSCGCEIPPPCWAPQPLGAVTSRVCPGNKAVVRLEATNCGATGRTIEVKATDAAVTIDPPKINLDAMEQATFVVAFDVPAGTKEGDRRDIIVWVHGCKEYFLRWTIQVTCKFTDCCQDVAFDDCPDLVHHWYDHFYCDRTCPTED